MSDSLPPSATMPVPPLRDPMIDRLRGMAVLNIVLIHTVFWAGDGWLVPRMVQELTLLIDVPLFFFVSGMTAQVTHARLGGAVRSIALLQLRYSFFCVLLAVMSALLLRDPAFVTHAIPWMFHNYSPAGPLPVAMGSMWFLSVFFVTYPTGVLLINQRGGIVAAVAAAVLLTLLMGDLAALAFMPRLLFLSLFYLFFFLAGHAVSKASRLWRSRMFAALAVFAVGVLAVDWRAAPLAIHTHKFPPDRVFLAWSFIGVLVAWTSCQWVVGKLPGQLQALIRFAGKNALSFYFSQGISSSSLYFLMPFYRNWPWVLRLGFAFSVNLALCVVGVILLRWSEGVIVRCFKRVRTMVPSAA